MPTIQGLWKQLPRGPRRWLQRQAWEQLSRFDTGHDLLFLNHGYAFEDDDEPPALDPRDEANRYPAQLYHVVAAPGRLRDKDVLEVGCGRGGGADYLARSRRPRSLVGVDLTRSAVDFCRRAYDVPGLSFVPGNAEDLPFPDASFDVVLNVESSVLYEKVERFLSEVHRVLRPGGQFLFADYRNARKLPQLRDQLERCGLEILAEENITRNVLASMRRETGRKRELIARHAPRLLRDSLERFAAVDSGDRELHAFECGARVYWRFVLQKRPD